MSYEIALERIKKAKEENAIQLDLRGLGLQEIPAELGELTRLEDLFLGYNQITEIKGLEKLTELLELELTNNQIKEIKNLDHLKKLRILNIELV